MTNDEKLVLKYLEQFGEDFVSPLEIARRAASPRRYQTQPGWARAVLQQFEQECIVEKDLKGRYRLKQKRAKPARTERPKEAPPELKALEPPAPEPAKSHYYYLGPSVVEVDDDQPFAAIVQSLESCSKTIKKAA